MTTDPATWTPGSLVRIVTANTMNLYRSDTPAELARYARVEDLIRCHQPDIVAVQEIVADGDTARAKRPGAAAKLRRLADATGLHSLIDRQPAVAIGGTIYHTALLWRAGITPVSDSMHTLERENAGMWHSAVTAVFDLGGPLLRVGSVHLSPFDQSWAEQDANQLLRVLHADDTPGILAGDFNGLGASASLDPDPYTDIDWHPDFVHQLDLNGHVDRRAAIRLERLGRMGDCARLAAVEWAPTTGHHLNDRHPDRRPDRIYATHHVPRDAVVAYHTAGRDLVGQSTDHCPVAVNIDPGQLPRPSP